MLSLPHVHPSVACLFVTCYYSESEIFSVCECASLCVQATMYSHACASFWVDVLKWGHFLSVWCLRNNPTAQKLLQPSASTYLSPISVLRWLCLYVWLLSSSHCLVNACCNTVTYSGKSVLCCSQYEVLTLKKFYFPLHWKNNVLEKWKIKISNLGNNVCGTVSLYFLSTVFTKKHAKCDVCFFGGHSIRMDVGLHLGVIVKVKLAW